MIRVVIAHASWSEGRRESLRTLLGQLHAQGADVTVYESEIREPSSVWAKRVWSWVAKQDGPVVVLNDDVDVHPQFMAICDRLVAAAPEGTLISLHAQGPDVLAHAERAVRAGHPPWVKFHDYSGPGVILPSSLAAEMLQYWDTHADELQFGPNNEDGVASRYLYSVQRPAWGTVPALVKHHTEVLSTLGYDKLPMRTSSVPYDDPMFEGVDLTAEERWRANPMAVPFIENPWLPVALLAQLRTNGNDRRAARARGETPPSPEQMVAKANANRPRVMIVTPTHGRVAGEYAAAVWAACRLKQVDVETSPEIGAWYMWGADIVRVRSRFLRLFLESNCTHLWMIDDDHSFDAVVLLGMLAANRDFVNAPYPQRRHYWQDVEKDEDPRSHEARAYRYTFDLPPGQKGDIDAQGCFEVARIGLGCALMTRAAVQKIVDFYSKPWHDDAYFDRLASDMIKGHLANEGRMDLPFEEKLAAMFKGVFEDGQMHPPTTFDDDWRGVPARTCAPFLMNITKREDGKLDLPSEDLAFCNRWREMGEKIWCYIGVGSPIHHHGETRFSGMVESFGIRPREVPKTDEKGEAAE